MQIRRILLASHGTPGAQAAERMALVLCAAGGDIVHLLVVPELWRGMMGDDWLNNASTRAAYGRHIEKQLQAEIDDHVARMRSAAAAGRVRYESRVVIGEPAQCLLGQARADVPDLIVIGSRRPKRLKGLRSRMRLESLTGNLPAPVMIVPHPE
jgi:nucleotide-binding universal stress UspA family protein